MKLFKFAVFSLILAASGLCQADNDAVRILFFSKSSGFEHSVISWKKGQPSHAEKVLAKIGKEKNWTFEFSKDGSKFSADYLKGFTTVIFYTTGDLTKPGKVWKPSPG